jgi:quercetin dioxygenase-like cupin family protein
MHSVIKGRQWGERRPSGRLVALVLGVAMSGLLGQAAGVHSQSIVGPGEGRALQVLGSTITVKIDGAQTAGRYAVIEEVSPVDGGPPLHVHHHEDELFYVQEGEVEFQLGEQRFRALAGSVAFLPKDVPHTFRNVGATSSKVLVVIIPARFVGFFEDIHALAQPTPEQFEALEKQYEVLHFLPPPKGN